MIDLDHIKATYTIVDAWHKLGYDGHPANGKCLSSPFREDRHPSFSISPCGRFFKDHATGEGGDVFTFVSTATGLGFKDALAWLSGSGSVSTLTAKPRAPQRKPRACTAGKKLVLPPIDSGKISELKAVANLRGFDGFYGLQMAGNAGHFGFTDYRGHRCWIVFDEGGGVAQVRRIDGENFENGAKALTLPGSNAKWPAGASSITEETNIIFLCEGTGDLLTAISIRAWDETPWRAVCMLGAAQRIDEEALHLFRGKAVVIYAQNDEAGLKAAQAWAAQLRPHAATVSAKVAPLPGADLNDTFVEYLESEAGDEF